MMQKKITKQQLLYSDNCSVTPFHCLQRGSTSKLTLSFDSIHLSDRHRQHRSNAEQSRNHLHFTDTGEGCIDKGMMQKIPPKQQLFRKLQCHPDFIHCLMDQLQSSRYPSIRHILGQITMSQQCEIEHKTITLRQHRG